MLTSAETAERPTASEAASHAQATPDPGLLTRRPILDQGHAVVGYELCLESADGASIGPRRREARERALLELLNQPEIAGLTAHKLTAVAISLANLNHPALEALPPGLAVVVPMERPFSEQTQARFRELAARGYRMAVDYDADLSDGIESASRAEEDRAMLALADFVRVDIERCNALQLSQAINDLGRLGGARMMAANLGCREEFEVCHSLPFEYLHGAYFMLGAFQRELEVDGTRTAVIELLNRTRANADIRVLEAIFKRDPLLTYRLLRYINSPGCGLTQTIGSIAQALMALGYEQLYRWLTLLLFAQAGRGHDGGAHITNALARGRLIELLGQDRLARPARDGLFIVGVFSMLDALLGVPLDQALADIKLAPEVDAALLRGEGPLLPYLELALACENRLYDRVVRIADDCGLDAEAVNAAHLSALVWAESIAR